MLFEEERQGVGAAVGEEVDEDSWVLMLTCVLWLLWLLLLDVAGEGLDVFQSWGDAGDVLGGAGEDDV